MPGEDETVGLEERGLRVYGFDLAGGAAERARARAAAAAPDPRKLVEFKVADGLHPTRLPGPFEAATEAGCKNLFGQVEHERFVQELVRGLSPGGRYYLLGCAFDSPRPGAPKKASEQELRGRFSEEKGWNARRNNRSRTQETRLVLLDRYSGIQTTN